MFLTLTFNIFVISKANGRECKCTSCIHSKIAYAYRDAWRLLLPEMELNNSSTISHLIKITIKTEFQTQVYTFLTLNRYSCQ